MTTTTKIQNFAAAMLLAFFLSLPGRAGAQIAGGRKPDVQVVVMPYPTGAWGVAMVYPGKVKRADAEKRSKELLAFGGWKGNSYEWEERGLERDPKLTKLPDAQGIEGVPVMSSLTLQTTGKVVDLGDGTMAVEPFVRAFRDLNRVHVTYLLPPTFKFRGLREFHDKNVDVQAQGEQGSWTYVVNIKNHQLSALNLPRYETVKPDARFEQASAAAEKARRLRRLVGTGAVVLLAVATGMFVWLWTRR